MSGAGGHSCEHQHHDHPVGPESGIEYSLYTKIDTDNLECLNEHIEGAGKSVFKPWEDRLKKDKYVDSDADEELLFNIPFTGNVKLKGIILIGGEGEMHPSKMRLFKNRPKMSFDDVSAAPDQEFELTRDGDGSAEYPTKIVKFSSVHHLTIHLPSNFGDDTSRVYYIGLRGEWSPAHHHGVTICSYESAPNVSDHKKSLMDDVSHQIM
ncbi:PITH domain-containing protein GA19395 [Frankliniella fusca]|uniref:PITH domain-containing protein GA19395 n=1 Tax=Frankliniella fusca TaxID=407009 RepID=A0AAE1H0A7_9NEOP|nr:PITH domain-containing protein GA19395 [Frankliniella fusca]